MPLDRVKVWTDNDVPTASELNAEFDNIINKFSANITAGDVADDILTVDSTSINAASYSTIKEAVLEAARTQKNVIIPPGTYNSDTQPIDIPNNVSIIGAGSGVVTITPATNYAHSQFIRITGTNCHISGVTIQCTNIASTVYTFDLINVETTEAADITISRSVISNASANVALSVNLLRVSTASVLNDLVRIEDTKFTNNNTTVATCNGIYMVSTYRIIVDRCLFTGIKNYNIRGDNLQQARVTNCRFYRTSAAYAAQVYLIGGVLVENNQFYSTTDFTTTSNTGWMLEVRAFVNNLAVVRSNLFSYTGTSVNDPTYGMRIFNNVSAYDNHGAVGTTGFGTAFIYYGSSNVNDYVYVQRNSVNTGEIYAGDSIHSYNYGKGYDSTAPFRMGNVFMWMHYTGTTNYLRFKKDAAPTSATDDHARVALTGATDISS